MIPTKRNGVVKSRCRRCQREADPATFVLDPVFRMAVCPACVKERKTAAHKPEPIARPKGWDEDDEELERLAAAKAARQAQQPKAKATRIDDSHVRVTCPKCNYAFTYDTVRLSPGSCPYCATRIS